MPLKSCIHPIACYIEDIDEGTRYCEWCEETESLSFDLCLLKDEIEALTTAIKGKAIIVEGGSPTIQGDVGYLLVKGGTVNIAPQEPMELMN